MSPPHYAPGGSPVELRETIADLMAVVEIRAEIIRKSAEIGDDAVIAFGLRCLTAELKAALSSAGMLAEIVRDERERRRASALPRHEIHEARP